MKLIQLTLITIFFTSLLNAEYLRTIRVGSYETQKIAKHELQRLNDFVSKQKNILEYQKSWDFTFKYRSSGKYFITIVEPMRDREVLQEVIDTLRISYPDSYVTKLKSAPAFEYKPIEVKPISVIEESLSIPEDILLGDGPIEDEVNTTQAVSVNELVEIAEEIVAINDRVEVINQVEEEVEQELESKVKEKVEPLVYDYVQEKPSEVIVKTEDKDESSSMYQYLFYITFFLLVFVSALLYRYKKKSIYCKDQEIQNHEIFTKKDREIRHKDSFLTHAKTSVATIHNFTNLLLEFDLTLIQKDYVQRIRSSSEHLLNTVNNTLDITKLKNETLRIENTEFDLNEMLRKVSKIITLEAKNNDTVFELNVEDSVPAFIFGDATRIRQVLINLLGNSVKFTKEGKISLSIKTLYNYTNAITLGFTIKDTGLGMSTEQVNDIHASSVDIVEDGTVGLGLSVTKQLIEMMNGEIKIYSTQDVGTTFTFTLKFSVQR